MLFSFVLPILSVPAGLYLMIKLKAFFILHPIKTTKKFLSGMTNKDERRSLCLALAGTLGVGNIFGVAAGIMIGGAGSVFWLFVSSLFAMIIKYSETVLSLDYASLGKGGMHRVLKCRFSRYGEYLSLVYALLCIALSLFMGASMQSAAVIDTAISLYEIRQIFAIIIFAFIGILMIMMSKSSKKKDIGSIMIGFAILMVTFHKTKLTGRRAYEKHHKTDFIIFSRCPYFFCLCSACFCAE